MAPEAAVGCTSKKESLDFPHFPPPAAPGHPHGDSGPPTPPNTRSPPPTRRNHLGMGPGRSAWEVPGRAWGVPGVLPQRAPHIARKQLPLRPVMSVVSNLPAAPTGLALQGGSFAPCKRGLIPPFRQALGQPSWMAVLCWPGGAVQCSQRRAT